MAGKNIVVFALFRGSFAGRYEKLSVGKVQVYKKFCIFAPELCNLNGFENENNEVIRIISGYSNPRYWYHQL